jgi:hypothetical protein
MRLTTCGVMAAFAVASMVSLAGQQPGLSVDKDDITIRGCVTRAERHQTPVERVPLVWSRNDILVSLSDTGRAAAGEGDPAGRLLYWLDDEDLSEHVGQSVEIKGDLKDVDKGQVEIDRDDDFTTIELKFDGREEKARIPTPWLRAWGTSDDNREFQVVVQRVDVDDVRVLGACSR